MVTISNTKLKINPKGKLWTIEEKRDPVFLDT